MKKLSLFLLLAIQTTMHAEISFLKKAYSYDDVLLVPQRSAIRSRKNVTLKTRLTRNIQLNIPLISANMDTVTEHKMAIAMAQQGGIGIIHRFNTIEEQVEQVLKVKRFRNAIVVQPLTIKEDATVGEARALMKERGISGLVVINDDQQVVGMLTSRDIRFRPCESTPIVMLMTPRNDLIVAPPNVSVDEAKKLLMKHKIEKLPLIDKDEKLAGLITSRDIYIKAEYPRAAVDGHDRLLVGAAIGVKEDSFERACALIDAQVDVLVIDIAHGHSDLAIETIRRVKEYCPTIDIIAGNVATEQGTRDLIEAGADAIKVGIGPGSICTTRITTGCGFPQLSAIMTCAQEAQKYDIPIIADGGIRFSGDITKAIAAGASTVMLGSMLAGTKESPGMPFIKNGKKFKVIRGMASFGAHLGRSDDTQKNQDYIPEGVEAVVPFKGKVREILIQAIGGLCSGLSYCGVDSVEKLIGNGTFVPITTGGIKESHAHDVQQIA